MTLQFKRAQRIAEQIRMTLSELLTLGLRDPNIGFVTITHVQATDDLKNARVYVSIYAQDKESTMNALKRAIPYLRRELGHRLQLRYVPLLQFCQDTSLEYGHKIESLLQDISTPHTNPVVNDTVVVPDKTIDPDHFSTVQEVHLQREMTPWCNEPFEHHNISHQKQTQKKQIKKRNSIKRNKVLTLKKFK